MSSRLHHACTIFLTIFTSLSQAAPTSNADTALAGTVSSTLKNGLKLIVREQHGAALVAIDLWIRAGSGQEGPSESGAAHFIEHLLFKGTAARKPGEIDAAFENMGTSLNAGTTRDAAHFYTTVPSQYMPAALEVLSDAVQHAAFDSTEMTRERAVILDEVARGRNDWRKGIAEALRSALYPRSPYGRPILGEQESLMNFKRDQVAAFFKRYYSPGNAALVLVGDVTPAEATKAVDKALGSWTPGDAPSLTSSLDPGTPTMADREIDGQIAVCGVGFYGPDGKSTVSVCAADVVTIILGDSRTGRLQTALKPLCAADSWGADFTTLSHQSAFVVYAHPNSPEQLSTVKLRLENEMQKLRTAAVSEEELDYAKRRLLGSYLFDIETYSGQARTLGLNEMASSYTSAVGYFETVRKLRVDDIKEFVSKYLSQSKQAVVLVKPKAEK
jgi:zinc protease